MTLQTLSYALLASLLISLAPHAGADVAALQEAWAQAMYRTDATDRKAAMATLAERARSELSAAPEDPALLIWHGIIVSSYAGEKGGLGALGLVKEARASLEHALELDPDALQGSAHTSLGSLYYKVPGWPLGFGSNKQARRHLEAALAVNPRGIDPNYFMGEFLYEQGEYAAAAERLRRALDAPDRPGRAVADAGRRAEIRSLLARVEERAR